MSLKRLKNFIYGVAAASFFSTQGCYALPPQDGLKQLNAEVEPAEVILQNLSPAEAITPPCPPVETIPISTESYRPIDRFEPIEVERPVERINLEDTLRLDISSIRPTFDRGFSLDQVTINLHGTEPRVSITDEFDDLYNPRFDPYGMRRDQEYQQNNGKLGAREIRLILQGGREVVRRLAWDGYRPFIYINRGLIYIERFGGLLQDIYGGIESLWTIDLGNLEQDFTDPLAPLRQALRVDERPRPEESRVQFSGRLEPTLNGKRIGTGSGQDLMGLIQGERDADLGFQFKIEIRW